MRNKSFYIAGLILAIVGVVGLAKGYVGESPKVVVEGNYIEAQDAVLGGGEELTLGAGTSHFRSSIQTDGNLTVDGNTTLTGTVSVTGGVAVAGEFTSIEGTTLVANAGFATTTLTAAMSGTTFYVSASGTDFKLPAVTNAGANYRFVVGAAVDGTNIQVVSSERDNIDGTLIVAGAVVDCRGEDQINFVVDGEQLGDYVEVRSNGTQWYIGDSGVLTASKMTCTDPF